MKTTLLGFLLVVLMSSAQASAIKLIVNENNPYSEISQDQLQDFFLKKRKDWPNGQPVRFFDRTDESPQRKSFLRDYIHKTQREIELFWIGQKLYTGHSAPTQVSSDSMVASLVSRFPGGIGYVSAEFESAKGIKVIEVKGR